MATLTELSLAGDSRFGLDRVRNVGCSRAVAGFTAYAAVIACQPLVHDPAMAQCALLLAGVLLFATDDAVERRCTVVTQIAKGVGDKKLPGEHKCDYDQKEDNDKDGYLRRHRLSLKRGWFPHGSGDTSGLLSCGERADGRSNATCGARRIPFMGAE